MSERTVDVPTATVTLLFKDIEGSTRLLQSLGGSYAEVLAKQFAVPFGVSTIQ
ncbi:MAG: hypothetical protein V3U32_04275 [Anaerolineales bacterium]